MAAFLVLAPVLLPAVLALHRLAAHPAAELLGLLAAAEDLGPRPVERLAVLLVGQTIGRQAEQQREREQQEQTLRGQAGRAGARYQGQPGAGMQAGQGSCIVRVATLWGGGSGEGRAARAPASHCGGTLLHRSVKSSRAVRGPSTQGLEKQD